METNMRLIGAVVGFQRQKKPKSHAVNREIKITATKFCEV